MTDNLIKGLYKGKEGNIQLLLISDKDLLKYNNRVQSKDERVKLGKKNIFEGLYSDR